MKNDRLPRKVKKQISKTNVFKWLKKELGSKGAYRLWMKPIDYSYFPIKWEWHEYVNDGEYREEGYIEFPVCDIL